MIYDMMYEFEDEDFTPIRGLIIVFKIAEQLYTIDQLIAAYKNGAKSCKTRWNSRQR